MRAVLVRDSKPVVIDVPNPTPKPDEVLIRVKATALNRADLLQVRGQYPPPPGAPETLGLEFAGEIITMGENVTRYKPGDRVMALVAGGGYAEQAVVHAAHCMPFPDFLSFEEAAAVPEAFLTAFSNMIEIGGLKAGETVLVHAGASSVGLAGIQMAKVIGAKVIVTASAEKHMLCQQQGADLTIDYKTENFAERILSQDEGVDLIVDMVGAPYWDDNVRVLKQWGRLVFVGLQGGGVKEINFGMIMRKRMTVTGSSLRDRTTDEKSGLVERFWTWAEPYFAAKRLTPIVWKVFPLEQVETAHDLMGSNANAGKIVLTV